LKNFSFSGIKLEVKGILGKSKTPKYILKFISPDNIVLQNKCLNRKNFRRNKRTIVNSELVLDDFNLSKKYIQLFDSYGEVYLKNTFYI